VKLQIFKAMKIKSSGHNGVLTRRPRYGYQKKFEVKVIYLVEM